MAKLSVEGGHGGDQVGGGEPQGKLGVPPSDEQGDHNNQGKKVVAEVEDGVFYLQEVRRHGDQDAEGYQVAAGLQDGLDVCGAPKWRVIAG